MSFSVVIERSELHSKSLGVTWISKRDSTSCIAAQSQQQERTSARVHMLALASTTNSHFEDS